MGDQQRFVTLPHGHVPCFPPRCLDCGGAPAEVDSMAARAFHPGHLILFLFMGRKVRLDVPYCGQCLWRVGRLRRVRRVTCLLGIAGAVALAWLVRDLVPLDRQNLVYAGAALAALAPALLWKGLAPPPIDVSVNSDGVRFEFRDSLYAEDFARSNAVKPVGESSAGRPQT